MYPHALATHEKFFDGETLIVSGLCVDLNFSQERCDMIRDQELAGLAMTLSRDAGVRVTIGGETSYCVPDGSHIHIARMPATSTGRLLMTGLVFHEVAHKNYTRGDRPPGLLGEMANIIEDVRVESRMVQERPGTGYDLEAVTRHYAGKGALEPHDLPSTLLGLVMAHGRRRMLGQQVLRPLHRSCREKIAAWLGPALVRDVENLLDTNWSQLASTSDSLRLAEELINLWLEHAKRPAPSASTPSPTPEQDSEPASPSPDNLDQCPSSGIPLPDKLQGKDMPHEEASSCMQNPPESLDTRSAESTSSKHPESHITPMAQDIREMLVHGSGGYGDLSKMLTRELDELAAQSSAAVLQGVPELPTAGRIARHHKRLDETQALCACARMRARLLVQLESYRRQPRAFGRTGRKLASCKLVGLALGDPRIFRRRILHQALNTAVLILLDTSGSMADPATHSLQRYQIANPAAYALHHTLYGLPGVKVATLAFSGRSGTMPDVNILADFAEKPHSAAFNLFPEGGTPTHHALWYARATLLQRPEPRKIILLVTDGFPANREATRAASERCEQEGIEIAALGIDTEAVRHFWKNHRVIRAVEELPQAMFAMMEKRFQAPR